MTSKNARTSLRLCACKQLTAQLSQPLPGGYTSGGTFMMRSGESETLQLELAAR